MPSDHGVLSSLKAFKSLNPFSYYSYKILEFVHTEEFFSVLYAFCHGVLYITTPFMSKRSFHVHINPLIQKSPYFYNSFIIFRGRKRYFKWNCVTRNRFSHDLRVITVKSDNVFYEPRAITIRSNNDFHRSRAITIKSDNFSQVLKSYAIT